MAIRERTEGARADLETSLKELQRGYIDLYWVVERLSSCKNILRNFVFAPACKGQ
jgi:hypothetical protein